MNIVDFKSGRARGFARSRTNNILFCFFYSSTHDLEIDVSQYQRSADDILFRSSLVYAALTY